MAITIEPKEKKYIDLPLTEFPVSPDNKDRMSDVSSVLLPLVKQYNDYYASGNLNACNNLIKNNPEMVYCIWNADKFNWCHDAIIAIQRYYLEDVQAMVNAIAQAAVGINDSPTTEEASLVAFSAEKILSLFGEKHKTIRNVSVPISGFNENRVFTYTNSIITSNYVPWVNFTEDTLLFAQKANIMVKTYNGYLTLTARKMPKTDLVIESILLTKI